MESALHVVASCPNILVAVKWGIFSLSVWFIIMKCSYVCMLLLLCCLVSLYGRVLQCSVQCVHIVAHSSVKNTISSFSN